MTILTDPNAYPSVFRKGQDSDAALINARFNALYNGLNTPSLSDVNFDRNAAITESKLALSHRTSDLAQRTGLRRQSIVFREMHEKDPIPISLVVVSSFIPQQRMDTNGVFNTNAEPFGIAYDEDRGVLWVSDNQREIIYRVNTSTGAALSSFYIPNTGPFDIGYENDNLWIIGSKTDEFYRFNTLGTVLSSFDQPTTNPHGMTIFNGIIYYSEDTTSEIIRLNTLGTITGRFDTPDGASAARPRGVGDDGQDLYYSDAGNDLLYKINTIGTIISSYQFGSFGVNGVSNPSIMGIDYDGSHIWAIDSVGYMLRCLPMQWDINPHLSAATAWSTERVSNIGHFITRDQIQHDINNRQGALSALTSFVTTESPTGGVHDIAIKRIADRTVPDLYILTGNSAAAAGNVVTRYLRGTFQSSFTLANLTGFLYFRSITFGDNYLWIAARDQTNGNVFGFQVQASIYDVDTTGAASLSSFQITDATLTDAWGIDYIDWDPNLHALWVSQGSIGGLIYKMGTTGGGAISFFNYSLGGAEVGRAICAPNAESILFTDTNGDLIYQLNTLGTAISSWNVSSSGANPNWSGLSFDYNRGVLWMSGEPASGSAEWAIESNLLYNFFVSQ